MPSTGSKAIRTLSKAGRFCGILRWVVQNHHITSVWPVSLWNGLPGSWIFSTRRQYLIIIHCFGYCLVRNSGNATVSVWSTCVSLLRPWKWADDPVNGNLWRICFRACTHDYCMCPGSRHQLTTTGTHNCCCCCCCCCLFLINLHPNFVLFFCSARTRNNM